MDIAYTRVFFKVYASKEIETPAVEGAAAATIVNPCLAKLSMAILLAAIVAFVISETIQFAFHIASVSLSVIAILEEVLVLPYFFGKADLLYSLDQKCCCSKPISYLLNLNLNILSNFSTFNKYYKSLYSRNSISLSTDFCNIYFIFLPTSTGFGLGEPLLKPLLPLPP